MASAICRARVMESFIDKQTDRRKLAWGGRRFPTTGPAVSKGFEVQACLTYYRKSKEVQVAGVKLVRRRVGEKFQKEGRACKLQQDFTNI